MAAPVISRLVLTDDDGTGLTGTPLNNALFQDLQNRIDTLSGQIYNGAYNDAINYAYANLGAWLVNIPPWLPGMLQTQANARRLTLSNVTGGIQIDMSKFDVCVCNDSGNALQFVPPIWSGNGGITQRDETSLVIRIRDQGTPVAITWTDGGAWASPMTGIPLPTTTASELGVLHIGFRFDGRTGWWSCVAIATTAN